MSSSPGPGVAEEEDDYLTMTFDDPNTSSTKVETLTQKKKRLAREAEIRGKPKSKADIAAEEKAKRDAALNKTSLDTSSKGYKMMAALGYKPGTALGATRMDNKNEDVDTRLLEPVGLEMKEGRSGIGADAEKKRKIREEFEAREDVEKKQKIDAGDFRERQQREREQKKMEGQVWGAMKVCEKLAEEDEINNTTDPSQSDGPTKKPPSKPLSSINVLWRGLVKQRAVAERDRRMRYDLHQSLSTRPDYDDPDDDQHDRIASGKKSELEEVDLELDQEDEELDQFEMLDIEEKLIRLVSYLREKWHYCFFCKFRYADDTMDGCPGLTEEEHD